MLGLLDGGGGAEAPKALPLESATDMNTTSRYMQLGCYIKNPICPCKHVDSPGHIIKTLGQPVFKSVEENKVIPILFDRNRKHQVSFHIRVECAIRYIP